MSVRNLQAAAEKIADLMSSKPEILVAYIFGSAVSGRARPDSDIDVAVLLDPTFLKQIPLKYRANLIADTGASLETFNVDVVLLNQAPPALAHNVITKGRLVYERSRSARVAFQVRNLNLFLDLEPIHKIRLKYLKRRYPKGSVHG
jgi:predicted nucleotidyltransferase